MTELMKKYDQVLQKYYLRPVQAQLSRPDSLLLAILGGSKEAWRKYRKEMRKHHIEFHDVYQQTWQRRREEAEREKLLLKTYLWLTERR